MFLLFGRHAEQGDDMVNPFSDGAACGGWTQILGMQTMGFSHLCADPRHLVSCPLVQAGAVAAATLST